MSSFAKSGEMFVESPPGSVFEGFISASGDFPSRFRIERTVLDDFDAGELFEDPTLRRIVCELGLFRLEALVHCHHRWSFFDSARGQAPTFLNQRQNRGGAVDGGAGNNRSTAFRSARSPA